MRESLGIDSSGKMACIFLFVIGFETIAIIFREEGVYIIDEVAILHLIKTMTSPDQCHR